MFAPCHSCEGPRRNIPSWRQPRQSDAPTPVTTARIERIRKGPEYFDHIGVSWPPDATSQREGVLDALLWSSPGCRAGTETPKPITPSPGSLPCPISRSVGFGFGRRLFSHSLLSSQSTLLSTNIIMADSSENPLAPKVRLTVPQTHQIYLSQSQLIVCLLLGANEN